MKLDQVVSAKVRTLIGAAGLFALLAGWIPNAHAQTLGAYKVSQIAVAGATATYPQTLNESAKVVGFYTTASATAGFELAGKKYKEIHVPGSNGFTRALGINDSSLIVGDFLGKDGAYHGFMLSDGKYTKYDVDKGVVSTSIFTVNDNADFAGVAGLEAFINIGGVLTEFYASGTDATYPYAINVNDEVVGEYFDAGNNSHGFYRDSSGTITEIVPPGAVQVSCFGINDSGVITGWYTDGAGDSHGFSYTAGVFQTLDFNQAHGINNKGDLVGLYVGPGAPSGVVYGILATPAALKIPATVAATDALSTSIVGVNNSSVMVGFYTDSGGKSHGLMLKGRKVTKIDDPNARAGTTSCQGINSTDQIVGYYEAAGGAAQAFLYSDGTFTDIGPAGAIDSYAESINDSGVIAGTYIDASNVEHAFTFDGSTYNTIDVPGADNYTYGWGINASGIVTMTWLDANGLYQAASYDGTTFTAINVPGAFGSDAHAINTSGNIVFTWQDYYGNEHGAILKDGAFYIFDDPNGTDTRADGINDGNTVVGRFLQSGSSTNFDGFKGVL
jgi:probable HAF family extracellular repeat protein